MLEILKLPFLASRRYLHGTTLFDALLPQAPPGAAVSMRISRIIESDRVEVGLATLDERAHASFSWRSRTGEIGELSVVPQAASPSPRREVYDEALVAGAVQVEDDGRRARFDGPPPFTFVATLIPLNKALLRPHMPEPGRGQWLFTRIDVQEVPERFVPLVLEYDGALAHGTLIRSRITVAGRTLGSLYFSWSAKVASQ